MLVDFCYELALQGRRFKVVHRGVLCLGFMPVYFYYDGVLHGRRFRVVYKGELGLGLIVVYLYFEFALPPARFRVVYGGVLGLGLIVQHIKDILKYKFGIPTFQKQLNLHFEPTISTTF
jgi:hypothetical protein